MLAVYRVGVHIPSPGIDTVALAAFFKRAPGTLFGLFDMFSGGAFEHMSVFALGIMPYVSAHAPARKGMSGAADHTHILTGQTKDRQQVVSAFQSDTSAGVFLLSLRAAGTGLNLTNASYVVLYDPWWNPAVEAQAIDRSHRIGQTQTVNAYRLIAPGTVEEKIWELQQNKAQTIADVLGEEGFARSLTATDLEYLFAEE